MQGHRPTRTAQENSATTDVIEIKPYDANMALVRPQAILFHLDANMALVRPQAILFHLDANMALVMAPAILSDLVAQTIVAAFRQNHSTLLPRPTSTRMKYLLHQDVMLGVAIGIGFFFALEVVQWLLTSQSMLHWSTAILGVIGAAGLAGTTLLLMREAYSSTQR